MKNHVYPLWQRSHAPAGTAEREQLVAVLNKAALDAARELSLLKKDILNHFGENARHDRIVSIIGRIDAASVALFGE